MEKITNPHSRPIVKLTRPFRKFIHIESSGGIVLAICTVFALVIANIGYIDPYNKFWNYTFSISIGSFSLSYPLWYWVNDGLMTIFFFVIGLEIKRELVIGELREPRKVILPVIAAFAGAIVPALIFFMIQSGKPGDTGWGIPMATDIAFVVGAMSILGTKVPRGLKVFLLSLAIIDDIIAVLVIAIFYTGNIKMMAILLAVLGLGVMFGMRRLGIRNVWIYAIVGAGVWLATLKSGIHPTIAGVAMGLMAPVGAFISKDELTSYLNEVADNVRGKKTTDNEYQDILEKSQFVSKEAIPPLERIETALHPWVAFFIMPVFALANAAVVIDLAQIKDSLFYAIAMGLIIGKPLGIFVSAYILVKLKIAQLPNKVTWPMILGAGSLAGIGFTMSLFIASLNLEGEVLNTAKTGIILASFLNILLGMAILSFAGNKNTSSNQVPS